ncbi:glycosyltransferase family 4 protein [Reinekea forsetii]|nr:glycosyltransferase family 4 protein [Reinekea forsetii]
MQKTVWYISKYYAPKTKNSIGGRGWLLMRELVDLDRQPVVITSNSNNLIEDVKLDAPVKDEVVEGVRQIWLSTIKYGVARSKLRVLSWFHFEWKLFWIKKTNLPRPDVVVVSSLSLLTVLNGLLLKKKYNCRLVFEVRDIWPLTIVEEGGVSANNPFVKFLGWIERLGYKYSDAIVGTMPNLEQHVRKVGCRNTPVFCIPMGVASEQLVHSSTVSDDYRKRYLSGSEMKVVHAGTVGITNALDIFFQAAEALKDNKRIKFILVGDGALKSKYQAQYGHLHNLVFAPKVDKSQVGSVLELSDIVYFSTFPSKVWEYGQSLNKLIDYMLSGKPVLASYSGYPSMVNEAECGHFIPSGDLHALVAALKSYSTKSKEDLKIIGNSGKEWLLENREYKLLARQYDDILFGSLK